VLFLGIFTFTIAGSTAAVRPPSTKASVLEHSSSARHPLRALRKHTTMATNTAVLAAKRPWMVTYFVITRCRHGLPMLNGSSGVLVLRAPCSRPLPTTSGWDSARPHGVSSPPPTCSGVFLSARSLWRHERETSDVPVPDVPAREPSRRSGPHRSMLAMGVASPMGAGKQGGRNRPAGTILRESPSPLSLPLLSRLIPAADTRRPGGHEGQCHPTSWPSFTTHPHPRRGRSQAWQSHA